MSLGGFAFLQFHPYATCAQHELEVYDNKRRLSDEHAPLVVALERASLQLPEVPVKLNTVPPPPSDSRRAIVQRVWQLLACQLVLAAFSFGVLPSVMSYVYRKYAVRYWRLSCLL